MKLIKKNTHKKDCGVVAAFNAASWCGVYRPYGEIEKAAKSCGYNPSKGIYHFQFAQLLRVLDIPAKKAKPKSREALESKIHLGKFYVLFYQLTGDSLGHIISAFTDHTGSIKIVNPAKYLRTWNDLMTEIDTNGVKELHVYEMPARCEA